VSDHDAAALAMFRASAVGRAWQWVVDVCYRAWLHSCTRRWTLPDATAATTARDRIVAAAWTAVAASMTALGLQQLAQPLQPVVWLVPAVVLTTAVLVIAACRTGREG